MGNQNLNYVGTSDRRANRNESWDSFSVFVYRRGTYDLVAFKFILVSFSALAIFRRYFQSAASSTLRSLFYSQTFMHCSF